MVILYYVNILYKTYKVLFPNNEPNIKVMKIQSVPTLYNLETFNDRRGSFVELFLQKKFNFTCNFTAVSFSKKNTIRGLHYQIRKPQIKFVTLLEGNALDVCVNIDKKSKNFGKIYKFKLSPGKILLIPGNFAHGIAFYGGKNILLYHLSQYRYPEYERGIAYNDTDLKIDWKIKKPILSDRDKSHPKFKEIK